MRYEITLNGKVYEVEVDDNRALIGAVRAARPLPPASGGAPNLRPPAGRRPQPEPRIPAQPQSGQAIGRGAPQPATSQKVEFIPAPMPGFIKEIRVQPGQQVTTGQVLMILEAMKMENDIVSPSDAVVAEVLTAQGKTVKPGEILAKLTSNHK